MTTTTENSAQTISTANWLRTIRRYIVFTAFANLIWEFAQLPLYTIWETGSTSEKVFAAVHCTGGDLLIAVSALLIALCLFGNINWPNEDYQKVFLTTVILGVGYTVFSEWLNIEIRKSWAYSELMLVIPIVNAGLSPVLQWIIIPIFGLSWARKPTRVAC